MSNWRKARSFLAYKWSLVVTFLWLGLYALDYFSSAINPVFPVGANLKSDQLHALAALLQDDRYRLVAAALSCLLVTSTWQTCLLSLVLVAVSYFTPWHFLLFLLPAVVMMEGHLANKNKGQLRGRSFGVLDLAAVLLFASLMLASSITLIRVQTWNYGLYMWCLAVLFLCPYLLWFAVWQWIGQLAIKTKAPLQGLVLVVLYFGYFFVTCRAIVDPILGNFASILDITLGSFYLPALFTTAFLFILPNPCKVQEPMAQAGWALAKPGFWFKFLLVGYAIHLSNGFIRGLDKDLIDAALVEGYHRFLPVLFVVLAAGLLYELSASKRFKIYRNIAALLVTGSVAAFFAFKNEAWTFSAESLWPYSTVVANEGRAMLEKVGLNDSRMNRDSGKRLF